jgi:hypothetical protein
MPPLLVKLRYTTARPWRCWPLRISRVRDRRAGLLSSPALSQESGSARTKGTRLLGEHQQLTDGRLKTSSERSRAAGTILRVATRGADVGGVSEPKGSSADALEILRTDLQRNA